MILLFAFRCSLLDSKQRQSGKSDSRDRFSLLGWSRRVAPSDYQSGSKLGGETPGDDGTFHRHLQTPGKSKEIRFGRVRFGRFGATHRGTSHFCKLILKNRFFRKQSKLQEASFKSEDLVKKSADFKSSFTRRGFKRKYRDRKRSSFSIERHSKTSDSISESSKIKGRILLRKQQTRNGFFFRITRETTKVYYQTCYKSRRNSLLQSLLRIEKLW